jgi:Tol biopolymer transport system component
MRNLRLPGNLYAVLLAGFLLLSCSGTKTLPIVNTVQPTGIPSPTIPSVSTQLPSISPIPTLTQTLSPSPTPPGGGLSGMLWVHMMFNPTGYYANDLLLQPVGSNQPIPLLDEVTRRGLNFHSLSPDEKRALVTINDRWIRGDPSSPIREHFSVFTLSLEDGLLTNLTDFNGADMAPSWSPDGSAIAFTRRTAAGGGDIMRINPDGSGLTPLTRDGVSLLPRWSPDSQSIAFTRKTNNGPSHLYVMAADGNHPRQLTYGDVSDGWEDHLVWSPDGLYLAFTRVAYTSNGYPNPPDSGMFLLHLASGELTKLENGFTKLPAWSPDGTKLAYSTGETCSPCANGLVVMELNSRVQTTLAVYKDQAIENVGWSPDGKMIVYSIWGPEDGSDREYQVRMIDATSGEKIQAWDGVEFFYGLTRPVAWKTTPADCPAGASMLSAGEQVTLAPDCSANPLRPFPGRSSFQLVEIPQGAILTLVTRACAPEGIFWLVKLPDGTLGWMEEGDGKASWLVPFTGR